MNSADWISLLLPAKKSLNDSSHAAKSSNLGSVELLQRAWGEICDDLRAAKLPVLILSPAPPHFPTYPRMDLLVEGGAILEYCRALQRTVEPGTNSGTHLSGLKICFHSQLPGGPRYQNILERSSLEANGILRPDKVDRLWIGGILSMLDPKTNWIREAAELLTELDLHGWSILMGRETQAARWAIVSVVRHLNIPVPERARTWLSQPIDRLSEDLILCGLAHEVGLPQIRAWVGWPIYFRYRFFPSGPVRGYRALPGCR